MGQGLFKWLCFLSKPFGFHFLSNVHDLVIYVKYNLPADFTLYSCSTVTSSFWPAWVEVICCIPRLFSYTTAAYKRITALAVLSRSSPYPPISVLLCGWWTNPKPDSLAGFRSWNDLCNLFTDSLLVTFKVTHKNFSIFGMVTFIICFCIFIYLYLAIYLMLVSLQLSHKCHVYISEILQEFIEIPKVSLWELVTWPSQ